MVQEQGRYAGIEGVHRQCKVFDCQALEFIIL
jgi:hypothetical protein